MSATALEIIGIYFLPPMAIGRLGGSQTPLESFTWVENPNTHGAGDTIIRPATTLELEADGTLRAYLPSTIRFRDGSALRPAAPFFELWARVLQSKQVIPDQPLTTTLLQQAGASLENLQFTVSVANHKASRRTGDPACGFSARLEIEGTDHTKKTLLSVSPVLPNSKPLVSVDRPITLGQVQIPKPVPNAQELGVNLDTVRIRFTPATGEVYGPPSAQNGLGPVTERQHQIVRPENRILNEGTSWTGYDGSYTRFLNPEPSDTYDGASIGSNLSWGVVDDTCDGVIEAVLVLGMQRLKANARIFVAPPDYAPDRRPFISLADDLADRDLGKQDEEKITQAEIADLFQRIHETVSLSNLDAMRNRHLRENANAGFNTNADKLPNETPIPATNQNSMTSNDKPFARRTAEELSEPQPQRPLPYTELANSTHAALADMDTLEQFLRENAERLQQLLRPPYATVPELSSAPAAYPQALRDPRQSRDRAHDMRMPPYMRDSDATPLSLTRRQYRQIMALLEKFNPQSVNVSSILKSSGADLPLPATESQRKIQSVIARRRRPLQQTETSEVPG